MRIIMPIPLAALFVVSAAGSGPAAGSTEHGGPYSSPMSTVSDTPDSMFGSADGLCTDEQAPARVPHA